MQLKNSFHVPLNQEETWDLLTDLPRIAPCMPGARLDDVVDGEYRGGLVAKVGPVTARYTGSVRFLERDAVERRAVIEARGREEKGNGTAQATVEASLHPQDGGTRVEVATEMAVGGRVAQFGRSLLSEVSTSMVDEFVRGLEQLIAQDGGDTPRETETASASAATGQSDGAAELDVSRFVVLPVLRRAAVPAVATVLGLGVGYLLGRLRGHRQGA